MKLDKDTITYIQNVVNTSKLVGINNAVIEPNTVRAIDDANTVVLWTNENVPDFEFGSLGLTRINEFSARYNVARVCDNFSIEAVVDSDKEFTKSLTMKGKGIKIDYRCANPAMIKAPKQLHDTPKVRIPINGETVHFLQKGQAAMGSEQVTFLHNENTFFEIVDINNDVFSYEFTSTPEQLSKDESVDFAFRYPIKTILALFKQNPEGYFDIGVKGTLKFPINDLNVFVLPQV